jgi:hypothetical protein
MEDKRVLRYLALGMFIAFVASACTRAGQDGASSTLRIQTPTRDQLSKSGVNSFAALPTDRRLCYGVSIRGPGITGFPGNTCAPETGVVSGFVEAGQPLEVFVARGENRTIELYMYTMPVGDLDPCPVMGGRMEGTPLKSTYLVGSKSGVALLNDVETVEITLAFPGLSTSVATQLNVPATCTPGAAPAVYSGYQVSSGVGTANGTGIKLLGRIGRPQSGTTATGAGLILYGTIK